MTGALASRTEAIDAIRERCERTVRARLGAGCSLEKALDVKRWVSELQQDTGMPMSAAFAMVAAIRKEFLGCPTISERESLPITEIDSFVYSMRSARGSLLYVGVADDVPKRLTQHRREKDWWPLVARVDIEPFTSRRKAEQREAALIRSGAPLFNIAHNLGRAVTVPDLARMLVGAV